MSSSGSSSGTSDRDAVFEDLWRQLRECHGNALQELESKVSKLKKERCLDAQRLEVFYNRNQQLKEQIKSLQDAMSVLEERLRTGVCERCSVLEENLKNNQEQNLYIVTKLKNEQKSLDVENTRLRAELEELKRPRSEPERASSSELEDGVIPDSPVRHSSLPTANKLKKRKNLRKTKRVHYEETPLPRSRSFIFNEPDKESGDVFTNPGRVDVLVPNTCELETSQTLKNVDENEEEEVAETCRLDLLHRPATQKIDPAVGQRRTLVSTWKPEVHLKPSVHVPDSTTDRSPSLLPRTRQLTVDGAVNKKRKKEESDEEEEEDEGGARGGGMEKQTDEKLNQTETTEQRRRENKKQTTVVKGHSAPGETSSQRANVSRTSPTFKKPIGKVKEPMPTNGTRRTPTQDQHESLCRPEDDDDEKRYKVEPMWSMDPALALSMYDSERRGDEHQEGETVDTDCTWISHSVLQRQNENSQDTNVEFGLALKANDSLDKMFDTSAYGEYNSPHLGRSHEEEDDDDDDDEEDEEEEEGEDEQDAENSFQRRKPQRPAFAHVAVIRKKDERRKLKGTTCKECEIFYAHLPEEEKQKKLSSCSRHRFLYIPPCTPENFWEVGFPSTQTCIDRGYIKEEKNPQARLRRRQPLNALFSPKTNQQEN